MAKVNVYNIKNDIIGNIDLNDKIFSVEVNKNILHAVVIMQRALLRQCTSSVKTRAETRGGGKKPWKQKGTGRARSGSNRSPVWRGGGVIFGPTDHEYSAYKITKKVRRQALCMALSARNYENKIYVFDSFDINEIKTKLFLDIMNKFEINNSLIVTPVNDNYILLSLRNIYGFDLLPVSGLNVYDILKHNSLIITKDALSLMNERLIR